MDDSRIVALFLARDEAAITHTDRKYGPYCRTISFNILEDRHDAEECTNDTYLQAWNTIPPQRPHSLQAYLGRIVRNLSLNKRRAKQAQKRGGEGYAAAYEELEQMVSSPSSVEESVDELVLRDLIERFLDEQTEQNRRIFIARYWYFESVHSIASKLDISQSLVKTTLLRMRNALREHLEREGVSV